MNLKFRYSTFLLLVFILIGLFSYAILQEVLRGKYILAIGLAALLYGITYLLGKRLQKVFLTLSLIKYIKNAHGVTTTTALQEHIRKAVREDTIIADEIIQLLVKEGIIEVGDETVLLVNDPKINS